jgi:hypothetical protein
MQIFLMVVLHNPKQWSTLKILIYGATGVVLKKEGSCSMNVHSDHKITDVQEHHPN